MCLEPTPKIEPSGQGHLAPQPPGVPGQLAINHYYDSAKSVMGVYLEVLISVSENS